LENAAQDYATGRGSSPWSPACRRCHRHPGRAVVSGSTSA